jgi:ABC-type cobalt transport system substrate-binding protein
MLVPVVQVRHVRVLVEQAFVAVKMAVELSGRITWRMRVLMVLVVHVQVLVLHGLEVVDRPAWARAGEQHDAEGVRAEASGSMPWKTSLWRPDHAELARLRDRESR